MKVSIYCKRGTFRPIISGFPVVLGEPLISGRTEVDAGTLFAHGSQAVYDLYQAIGFGASGADCYGLRLLRRGVAMEALMTMSCDYFRNGGMAYAEDSPERCELSAIQSLLRRVADGRDTGALVAWSVLIGGGVGDRIFECVTEIHSATLEGALLVAHSMLQPGQCVLQIVERDFVEAGGGVKQVIRGEL